jgi:diguanylate cyclase (GGDEF)-like protein
MAQVPTRLSLALTEAVAKAAATGLTQKDVAERIVTRSRRRRAPGAHPDETVLIGRWQRNLSNWKTGKSLPATFDDLKAAVTVIAPDTPAEYWFGLWAQARGGPTVSQGDEEHPRKPAFSFVPHSPHGRIYGDRNGGNVYLRKQLPLDAEVILGSAGSVCSILMIDIDDLTQINKRCGTEAGDDVLQVTNMQLAENPAVWVNGRCGDDTFFAVVPNLSRDEVRLVARKTCERFRGHAWDEVEAELHVTCSVGFAHSASTNRRRTPSREPCRHARRRSPT